MSKVFIVRFHVIQFTRYSALPALAVSLAILSHSNSFVKYFFQVFQLFSKNFSFVSLCDAALADSFDIITDPSPFVKLFFQNFSSFSYNFFKTSFPLSFSSFRAAFTAFSSLILTSGWCTPRYSAACTGSTSFSAIHILIVGLTYRRNSSTTSFAVSLISR